jgi:GNAT superfamily N-acetyltransferase
MGGHIMVTKKDIFNIAKAQFALDYNCQISDFDKKENTISENELIAGRRIYSESDGCFFKMICTGNTMVISASSDILPWCQEKLVKKDPVWIFEYPKLRAIDKKLNEFGHEINDIHQYYLPDPQIKEAKPLTDIKWFEYDDIIQFKGDDRFGEAFAFDVIRPDVLAVAALDGNNIIGMAGASADCENMWQIGIDVFPEYRERGIGTNLVALLKDEVLKRGKVPFYGTCQSHISSQNIAVSSGFFPVWAELYSGKIE